MTDSGVRVKRKKIKSEDVMKSMSDVVTNVSEVTMRCMVSGQSRLNGAVVVLVMMMIVVVRLVV